VQCGGPADAVARVYVESVTGSDTGGVVPPAVA
jgi:hypothetical protein